MDPQVNLSVTYRGDTQSFLVSDSLNTTWADVEAMVKVSFDLNDVQIKYLDEDHDEVSVNTSEEYEEALKIAMKQDGWLQMNVYEASAPPEVSSQQASEKSEKPPVPKDGRKPLSHYSMLARTLRQDKDAEKENEKTQSGHHSSEVPPEWFTSYLERFRAQVVQETVEMVDQKLSEKLPLSSQVPNSLSSSTHHATVNPTMQGNPFDWLLSCSNCQASIVGIRYQCSICPSYSICELCEAGIYAHDPNHVLLKLRRPVLCISETYNLGQFSPRLATLEQVRLQKQMDKRFLKAEKQRLRAEKKQRKAEVRELKKQLKLHRKLHLWNSVHALDSAGLTAVKSESLQPNALLPLQGCPVIVPTLSAAFVDENLPDGTHLQPRTMFIKHWRMRNTGNMEWSSETKLKFMWGNLTLVSSEKKDVTVPSLLPGEVGIVSVEFVAPPVEGIYTSHWRLSHRGEQFGPRIWCSIVVDSSSSSSSSSNMDCPESDKLMSSLSQKDKSPCKKEENFPKLKAETRQTADSALKGGLASLAAPPKVKSILNAREFYIPSVDLLTAQDLLSFELLDINIVQELEQVPHNTSVEMPPLPRDNHLLEKVVLDQIEEESKGSTSKPLPDTQGEKGKTEHSANQEEGEEDMSGTQFVCETVIRSLTLDAAPDHKPLQRKKSLQRSLQALQDTSHYSPKNVDPIKLKNSPFSTPQEPEPRNQGVEVIEGPEEKLLVQDSEESSDREAEDDAKDEVCSQASSTSSEDYVVILPECFDTSRPLGESMYSSALSQPSLEKAMEAPASPGGESKAPAHSINDILTTSQTLDEVPLIPQVLELQPGRSLALSQNNSPQETSSLRTTEAPSLVPDQMREEHQDDVFGLPPAVTVNNMATCPEFSREYPLYSHCARSTIGGDMKACLLGGGSSPLELSSPWSAFGPPLCSFSITRHTQVNSLAGGLVKGALSVAASAYKALFAGPTSVELMLPVTTEEQTAAFLASLSEMGFCDRQLNLRLLQKHNCDMAQVVTELLQLSHGDWYGNQY